MAESPPLGRTGMSTFLKNPMTHWLSRQVERGRLLVRHRGKHLRIFYMARGKDCEFGKYVTLYDHALVIRTSIGDMSYVGASSRVANATIGKFCCLGPEVVVGLGRHPSSQFVSSHPAFYSTMGQSGTRFVDRMKFDEYRPIEIGNDVWIGMRAIILDGVKIGNGAIVGAGAVVTSDVPPYAIVAGIPAQLVRYRFSPDIIARLESLKWWDRDQDWLRKNVDLFEDVAKFVDTHSSR